MDHEKEEGQSIEFSQIEDNTHSIGCFGGFIYFCSFILFLWTFPLSLLVCLKIVHEYERAVIFRLGRLIAGGAKGPGIFFILPCIDDCIKVDLRVISFDVPPQEILTKDSVTITVDAVTYYRITNPVASICNVQDLQKAVKLLAQSTLRNELGTKNLSEVLLGRDVISQSIQHILDVATDPWGVKINCVEIKDVSLPHMVQRAMAAEGEMNASLALKEASDIISESPHAIQLR